MMNRAALSAVSALLLPGMAFAQGGPPLLTDDPETPEVKSWEINLAVTAEISRDETHFEAPIADINYGFTDRIQLKYEVPWVISNTSGETSQSGFGQSIAGVKYRFLDKDKAGVAVSTYPQITFSSPVSDRLKNQNVDNNTGNVFLPIEVEQNIEKFELNEEVGYQLTNGQTSQLAYGFAATYPIHDGFVLLSELHGHTFRDFSDDELVMNIGTQAPLYAKMSALISVGRSLRDFQGAPSRYLAYIGMQFLL